MQSIRHHQWRTIIGSKTGTNKLPGSCLCSGFRPDRPNSISALAAPRLQDPLFVLCTFTLQPFENIRRWAASAPRKPSSSGTIETPKIQGACGFTPMSPTLSDLFVNKHPHTHIHLLQSRRVLTGQMLEGNPKATPYARKKNVLRCLLLPFVRMPDCKSELKALLKGHACAGLSTKLAAHIAA